MQQEHPASEPGDGQSFRTSLQTPLLQVCLLDAPTPARSGAPWGLPHPSHAHSGSSQSGDRSVSPVGPKPHDHRASTVVVAEAPAQSRHSGNRTGCDPVFALTGFSRRGTDDATPKSRAAKPYRPDFTQLPNQVLCDPGDGLLSLGHTVPICSRGRCTEIPQDTECQVLSSSVAFKTG